MIDGEQLRRDLSRAVSRLSDRLRADPFQPDDWFELRAALDTFYAVFGGDSPAILSIIRVYTGALGLVPKEDPTVPSGVLRVTDLRTRMHEDVSVAAS